MTLLTIATACNIIAALAITTAAVETIRTARAARS